MAQTNRQQAENRARKAVLKFLSALCLPFLLCAAGLDPIDPDAAGADFLPPSPQTPPDTTVVATISGKWIYREITDPAGMKVPSISLKTEDYLNGDLNFTLHNEATAWDIAHDSAFRPQIRAVLAFNPKILHCDGLALKLWFEDGQTLPLGTFTCDKGRLITGTDDTDRAAQDNREEDLAKFLIHHHPVAITQGRASVLLNYAQDPDFSKFQKAINPSLNPEYFKQARQKWKQDIKKGSSGLEVQFQG